GPSESEPLSLHDALPISSRRARTGGPDAEQKEQSGRTRGDGMRVTSRAVRRATMLAGMAIIALPGQALAQKSAENQSSNDVGFGAPILVTAERRAMNLQDTPISIVAVTEETIAAKGIEDLADLGSF